MLDKLTRIHCLNITNTASGKKKRYNSGHYDDGTPTKRDGSLEEGLRLLMEAECIGGHNVIGFDVKAIQKLFPWFQPKGYIRDSLVEARVVWPNIFDIDNTALKAGKRTPEFVKERLMGTHKLAAWGHRLGLHKGDYSARRKEEGKALGLAGDELEAFVWRTFTLDMDDYCALDNDVTETLFAKIDSKEWDAEVFVLENEVAHILRLQEDHGFLFDRAAADELIHILQRRHAELGDQLRQVFKPWFAPVRKKGKHDLIWPARDNKKFGYVAGCPATRVEETVFNPASRDHIADRMITLFGWTPLEFTPTGKPEVNETTLEGLDYPEAKLLVEYLTVEKRLGQIVEGKQAWLRKLAADGRIHGRVNTNGAVTGRMTHSDPNMAQVPAAKSAYGKECRALFIVRPGYKLVGCDAEGLELRMLGHYHHRYDGGAFSESVVNGDKTKGTDAHTINKNIVRLNSRDAAKTFIYALIYGAGNGKLGAIVYDDYTEAQRSRFHAKYPAGEKREEALVRVGSTARRRIMEGLPALAKLTEMVKAKAKRGYILGLDKRRLIIRSANASLNTLLQSAGAIAMKRALVIAYNQYLALGWTWGDDFAFTANVHDEVQMEVREDLAEQAGRIFADAIRLAGEFYALHCPLAGDYGIGNNWAETH
ncbi:DNA polymerase [Caulobacter sp.]|uniref:DNA polymerase n=1 Tax=Caulobacter sp. TaxID=78 RepID=UPI0031D91801